MQSYIVKLPETFKPADDIKDTYGSIFKQRAGNYDPSSPIIVRGDVYYSVYNINSADRKYYMMVDMSNKCTNEIRKTGLMTGDDAIYGTHGYNNLIKDQKYIVYLHKKEANGQTTIDYVSDHMLTDETCIIL
jgi:hypothetical protein